MDGNRQRDNIWITPVKVSRKIQYQDNNSPPNLCHTRHMSAQLTTTTARFLKKRKTPSPTAFNDNDWVHCKNHDE